MRSIFSPTELLREGKSSPTTRQVWFYFPFVGVIDMLTQSFGWLKMEIPEILYHMLNKYFNRNFDRLYKLEISLWRFYFSSVQSLNFLVKFE